MRRRAMGKKAPKGGMRNAREKAETRGGKTIGE